MEQCAIEMKLRKAVQAKDYVNKLLQECITWGGPCTTADELCHILTQKPDQERVIVRTEMAFFLHIVTKQKKLQDHLCFT